MAPDDRDRNLDKALARHFRSSARDGAASAQQPVGPLATASSASAIPLSACPDAEILAAYHDSSLSSEELVIWKSHLLACPDCHLILEHLAVPLEEALTLNTAASPLVAAQSAQLAAPVPAAASAPASPSPVAPAAISITRSRKTYFRWLVPTGAVAAGLLTWIVVHESGIPKLGPPALRVQTAEHRPSALAPSSPADSTTTPVKAEAQRVAPPASSSDNERQRSAQVDQLKTDLAKQAEQKEKDQSLSAARGAVGAVAPSSRADEKLRDRLQSAEQLPHTYANAPSHGPRVSQQQQQQAQLSARAADSGAAILDKKVLPPSSAVLVPRDEPSFVQPGFINPSAPQPKLAQPAPAPPPPPASSSAASGTSAASPPKPASSAKARTSEDSVSALTQTVTVESTPPSANWFRAASAAMRGPQIFNDPAHQSVWRVGPAGSVEFSADNGATFAPQSTGIAADLFTGSAPAAKVCWIVGASGAILRTTDAGQHWLKLHAPIAADILGIHATDAFHATIWLVPDPKSSAVQTYKTSDGALTWSLVSQ